MNCGFLSSIIALTQTVFNNYRGKKKTPGQIHCFFRQKGEAFTRIETTSSVYSLAFITHTGPSKSFQILYCFYAIIPCTHHTHQFSRQPFIIIRIQTFNISKHIPAFPHKLNPMKGKEKEDETFSPKVN